MTEIVDGDDGEWDGYRARKRERKKQVKGRRLLRDSQGKVERG